MKCPFCGHIEDKVVDSRLSTDGEAIRRRRECEGCNRRFTSYERVEEIMPMVVKKDGRREPFDRQKVLSGLKKACEKRPISMATLESAADEIEKRLLDGAEKEIASRQIGEEIMKRLHELDEVAYVRFASVYREFKDINEFMKELKDLLSAENKKK
ncbi:MAG: transcriptional repressor NrdR [Nitrospirae bacterium]|nr:transcriptional repressor NrdR [Nitrospirota bacterium]